MVYRIQINQIGKAGVPIRQFTSHEVDIIRPAVSRIATVFTPSGVLILADIGRLMVVAGDER